MKSSLKKSRCLAKTRSLLGYLLQVLCFLLFGEIIIGGLFYLPIFWGLLLASLLGFALGLGIDYRKAPPISCLPIQPKKLKKSKKLPNRSFFALREGHAGFFRGKKRGFLFWTFFSLLIGFLVIAFSNLLAQLLIVLFPWLPTFQISGVEKILAQLSPWQALLLVVLVPAVLEELVFRGRGFALLARTWDRRSTIFLSSIIFASVHASPVEILSLLPLAFYLGWLRYHSGNLCFTILVHLQNNGIAFLWYTLSPPIL